MVKISVLVSGGGTNLQALINSQNNGILSSGKIVQVISSRRDAYALKRAESAGIPAEVIEAGSDNFEGKILECLEKFKPEVIVLAGFMHILSKSFIDQCGAKIINVHPSLIPSFCGKGFYGLKVHEAVLKSGVKVTGATVHLVNEIPDGGEILAQKPVKIFPDDTPEKLQRRVMEQAEWVILPRAVEEVCKKLNPKIFPAPIKYPGRGIITGMTPSGKIMLAYFIMGRSASSKARIFERSGDDLIIKLTKQDKNFDSSLILYSPLRMLGKNIILTNGDQTDTIYDFMSSEKIGQADNDFMNAEKNCRTGDKQDGKNDHTDIDFMSSGKNSQANNDLMNYGKNCRTGDDFLQDGKNGRTDNGLTNIGENGHAENDFINTGKTHDD
ncbi:MAG: phosphoribosylglycinamide formyltransferase, partial [Synergistaceae bacterium]|nr:phosphoribosylglycinamide formyltransferase [Synergistaceae bacterium]